MGDLVERANVLAAHYGEKDYAAFAEQQAKRGNYYNAYSAMHDHAAELEAENARLREALKPCLAALTDEVIGTYNHDDPDWYRAVDEAAELARQALGQKP